MKFSKSIIGKAVCCVIVVILIVGLCIGNAYAARYSMQLTAYLAPPITNSTAVTAAREEGQAMAKRVETEGTVLLRNEGGTLPLDSSKDTKVNVFGYGSVDWSFGGLGTGSSGMIRPENDDVSTVVDLLKALTRYGINYNTELTELYKKYVSPLNGIANPPALDKSTPLTISEPPMSYYPASVLSNAEAYSDTAIVVISRTGVEAMDMPTNQTKRGSGVSNDSTRTYLQISAEEEELLTYVGSHYEKTVVIINTGNVMELEFLERIPGLDACLMVGMTGTQAASAIPALIYGEETPSGHLADTIAYDFKTGPADVHNWFGNETYSSGGFGTDYVEGIYVGYRWYETADKEGVWSKVNNDAKYGAGHSGYNGVVQYPFGFGLSYTDFSWTVNEVTPAAGSAITDETQISIDVTVKNEGSAPGRDVVEAYVTVPYTKGGIEKSYVTLVGYTKTQVIAPGASQKVTVEIDADDFTSYDCYDKNENGFKGYELEQGTYAVKLMTDSHNVKTVDFEGGNTGVDGVINYVVDETIKIQNDKISGAEVKNLFTGSDAIDGFALDGIESDYNANIPYMSRADFNADYAIPERTAAVKNRVLSAGAIANASFTTDQANAWDTATTDEFGNPVHTAKVTWGKNSNLKVAENGVITELGYKLGADYDAEEWEAILDQITFNEAVTLIGPAISGNAAVNSIGKPRLYSYDSIMQIRGYSSAPRGTGNPSSVVLAQTWNDRLVYEFGLAYGNEMNSLGVQSVFGPGVNIHRSPYTGRNWEYLSEDAQLTSSIVCSLINGIQDRGCSVEVKHLALNEQEAERNSVNTWLSEQALREVYLKPFQRAIQKAHASGIMTAYNKIGSRWTGGSTALMTGVLRNEWGFNGLIDTDWSTWFGPIDQALRAGGDLGMTHGLGTYITLSYSESSSSNRLQYQMREAVHHVLYSWLSSKYQGSQYVPADGSETITSFVIESWQWWEISIIDFNVLVAGGCVAALVGVFWPRKKKTAEGENEIAASKEGE